MIPPQHILLLARLPKKCPAAFPRWDVENQPYFRLRLIRLQPRPLDIVPGEF
jgi:hypothetical protein